MVLLKYARPPRPPSGTNLPANAHPQAVPQWVRMHPSHQPTNARRVPRSLQVRDAQAKRPEQSLSCRDHLGCRSRLSWLKCSSPTNPCQPCRAALNLLHRHIIPHRAEHDDDGAGASVGEAEAGFAEGFGATELGDHGLAGFFAGLGCGGDGGQGCGE